MSHVADTLLLTILFFLLARYFRNPLPSRWLPVVMGAVVGYATTVRFFNVFFGVALVIGFACYRRIRPAATIAIASAATFGVLATIPFLVGVDSLTSGYAAEGVPGKACNTITRPGSIDTTLPNPFRVEVSICLSCSNCCGSKNTECGSSRRSMPGIAP